ncbi:hypothetical protein CRUP_014571 [Coryphaenoides rupestris]|nr:hypothetical protein CRUP_014571 [Coryphaenoides rupestris]
MMFSPMKAVTRHMGIPVDAAAPISPISVSSRPRISRAELAMLLGGPGGSCVIFYLRRCGPIPRSGLRLKVPYQ